MRVDPHNINDHQGFPSQGEGFLKKEVSGKLSWADSSEGVVNIDDVTITGSNTVADPLQVDPSAIIHTDGTTVLGSNTISDPLRVNEYPYGAVKDPTGFDNPVNVIITYSQANRTMTLTGTFTAYWKGSLVSILTNGWVSSAHASSPTAPYHLYYDGSSFIWDTVEPTFEKLQIASVYYTSAGVFIHGVRKCYSINMPYSVRKNLNKNVGAYIESGGDFSGYTANSYVPANKRPNISLTYFMDEDLQSNLDALTSKTYSTLYLTGATGVLNITDDTSDVTPLDGSGVPHYNLFTGGVWTQGNILAYAYTCSWVICVPTTEDTTSKKRRYLFMQGQATGGIGTVQSMRPSDINFGEYTNKEYFVLAKIIIYYVSGTLDYSGQIHSIVKYGGTRLLQSASGVAGPTGHIPVWNGAGDGLISSGLTMLGQDMYTLGNMVLNFQGGKAIYSKALDGNTREIIGYVNSSRLSLNGNQGGLFSALPVRTTGKWGLNVDEDAIHDMKINGRVRISSYTGLGADSDTTHHLKVSGKSFLNGRVGIGVASHATYMLDVVGEAVRFQSGLISGTGTVKTIDENSDYFFKHANVTGRVIKIASPPLARDYKILEIFESDGAGEGGYLGFIIDLGEDSEPISTLNINANEVVVKGAIINHGGGLNITGGGDITGDFYIDGDLLQYGNTPHTAYLTHVIAYGNSTLGGESGSQETRALNTSTNPALRVTSNDFNYGSGGEVFFGAVNTYFANIKSFLVDGANNGIGLLSIGVRAATTDSTLTERMAFYADGTVEVTGTLKQNTIPVVTESGSQVLTNKSIVASQITQGTFNSGNYTFPSDLTVNGALNVASSSSGVYEESNFTVTWTGFSGSPTSTCYFVRVGKLVTLTFHLFSATSNANTFGASVSIPSAIRPSITQILPVEGNALLNSGSGLTTYAAIELLSSGAMTMYMANGTSYWASSGNKGINKRFSVTYTLL